MTRTPLYVPLSALTSLLQSITAFPTEAPVPIMPATSFVPQFDDPRHPFHTSAENGWTAPSYGQAPAEWQHYDNGDHTAQATLHPQENPCHHCDLPQNRLADHHPVTVHKPYQEETKSWSPCYDTNRCDGGAADDTQRSGATGGGGTPQFGQAQSHSAGAHTEYMAITEPPLPPIAYENGYFGVLSDQSLDMPDDFGASAEITIPDSTGNRSTLSEHIILNGPVELPEEVAESFLLEFFDSKNSVSGEEVFYRADIQMRALIHREISIRRKVVATSIDKVHCLLLRELRQREQCSRRYINRLKSVELHLVENLSSEKLARKTITTEWESTRQKLIGSSRGPTYCGRVLAWLVKTHSRGQRAQEWAQYAGVHLNPHTHSEQSLVKYLRSCGVLHEAHAYNTPRYVSYSNTPIPTSTTPLPPLETAKNKQENKEAIEASEAALVRDLIESLPVPADMEKGLDDFDTARKETMEDCQNLWYSCFTEAPDTNGEGIPESWLSFGFLLDRHLVLWSLFSGALDCSYAKEALWNQSILCLGYNDEPDLC